MISFTPQMITQIFSTLWEWVWAFFWALKWYIFALIAVEVIIILVRRRNSWFFHKGWRTSRAITSGTRQPTPYARKLGNLLERLGWRVEFEKWDGHKHIDIAITEAKTNIEVDGSQHNLNPNQAMADMKRDSYSEQKGFITKRISNSLLSDDTTAEETVRIIDAQLRARVNELKK